MTKPWSTRSNVYENQCVKSNLERWSKSQSFRPCLLLRIGYLKDDPTLGIRAFGGVDIQLGKRHLFRVLLRVNPQGLPDDRVIACFRFAPVLKNQDGRRSSFISLRHRRRGSRSD